MISLLKLEGTLDNATCYVTVNDQLVDIITDFASRPCFETTKDCILKIVVKNAEQAKIGSVCVDTTIIPFDTPQWLPLLRENDYLKELPENTKPPRVLISFTSDKLPSVTEVSEISSSGESQNHANIDEMCSNLVEKNKGLMGKVFELENFIQEKKWKEKENLHQKYHEGKNFEESEKVFRVKIEQMEMLKFDLEKKANSFEMLYKQERYQREYLEKQINMITQEFENLLQGQNKRIAEYKSELAQLYEKQKNNQEIIESLTFKLKECEAQRDELKKASLLEGITSSSEKNRKEILTLLQDKFEESEFQRKVLKEKLESLNIPRSGHDCPLPDHCLLSSNNYSELQKSQSNFQSQILKLQSELSSKTFEISKLVSKVQQFEQSKKKIYNSQQSSNDLKIKQLQISSDSAKQSNKALQNTVELLTEQVKILSEKLAISKQLNYELSHVEKDSVVNKSKLSSDNADERFGEYIKNYGIEHQFERVAEGVYSFGSKKVSITIKNGYLVCRVGGGYMMIEEFLRLILNKEVKLDEEEGIKRPTEFLSPRNSSRNQCKRSISQDYEPEGSQTERILGFEYDFSNPINGLKENQEFSPGKFRLSPANKRAFTPLRRGVYKRIYK